MGWVELNSPLQLIYIFKVNQADGNLLRLLNVSPRNMAVRPVEEVASIVATEPAGFSAITLSDATSGSKNA